MPQKLKLTISLDEDLVQELGRISRKTKKPRSRLVQEALRIWQRTELQEKLAQGYREMADENLEMAEQGLSAFNETPK